MEQIMLNNTNFDRDQNFNAELKALGLWNFTIELQPGVFTIPRNRWKTHWHSIIVQDYIRRCVLDYLNIFNCKPKTEIKIIDIGCNEGWLSLSLYKEGYKNITGLDANKSNIKKANFLKDHFQMDEAKFICDDISNFKTKDTFDFSIMLGVINHINNPLMALENICSFTNEYLFLDFDSFLSDDEDKSTEPKFDHRIYSVHGRMECHFEPKSQVTSTPENNLVFQYSKRAVTLMMNFVGFSDIFHATQRISVPSHYKNDKRVFLIAKKDKTRLSYYREFELEESYTSARKEFDFPVPVLIEEFKAYNIIRYGDYFFGIPHGELEDFDITKIIYNEKCLFGGNVKEIKSIIYKIPTMKSSELNSLLNTEVYDSFRFDIGKEMIRQDKINEAKIIFNNLMQKYSEVKNTMYLNSLYQLGKIEQKSGNCNKAVLIWETCNKIDPEYRKAALRLKELKYGSNTHYSPFT